MGKAPSVQISIRLPAELLKRVDAYAVAMNAQSPGVEATRADALRVLLTRALGEAKRKPKRRME